MIAAILALCLGQPNVIGPQEVEPYHLCKLTVEGVGEDAKLFWRVTPKADFEEVGHFLFLVGKPGEYEIELFAINFEAKVANRVYKYVTFTGQTPTPPTPNPPEPGPEPDPQPDPEPGPIPPIPDDIDGLLDFVMRIMRIFLPDVPVWERAEVAANFKAVSEQAVNEKLTMPQALAIIKRLNQEALGEDSRWLKSGFGQELGKCLFSMYERGKFASPRDVANALKSVASGITGRRSNR